MPDQSSPRSVLWLAIPPVLVLLTVWTNNDFPLDYWLHVNYGRWMAEHGRLVTTDEFSHTIHGQAVLNQPWLAQSFMYRLHEWGGYRLNQFVAGAGYAAGLAGAVWLAWRRSANATVAGLLGVLAFGATASNLGVRPQWFSVVLFSAEIVLLARVRKTWALAAGAFVIGALWTNLHGAYPLAVVLPGLMAAAMLVDSKRGASVKRFWPLASAAMAAGLGTFVRPDPQNALAYVAGVSASSVARGLEEWMPPAVDRNFGAAFFFAVVGALIVLGLARRRLSLLELALVVAFLVPALNSQRMAIWWGLLLPVVLARPAASAWRRFAASEAPRRAAQRAATVGFAKNRAAEFAAAALLVAMLAASTPWTRAANPLLQPAKRASRPVDEPWDLAARLAATHDERRTFAPLRWASYFTWHSHGRLKSFVDSRVDVFPDDVWNDYMRICAGGDAALRLLNDYQVDIVVCDGQLPQLRETLRGDGHWRGASEAGVVTFLRKCE